MNILQVDIVPASAKHVRATREALVVDLADGRTLIAPLAWFPRLLHATAQERNRWRLIGQGEGIHWPDLDEDISVEGLLAGSRSGESQASFARWLSARGRKIRAKKATANVSKGHRA